MAKYGIQATRARIYMGEVEAEDELTASWQVEDALEEIPDEEWDELPLDIIVWEIE